MNRLLIVLIATLSIIISGCEPGPKPIAYGEEACAYCRMSIVDKRYAAQLVSETGKTFSFDAIECMIHYQGENHDHAWHMELVTDYTQPTKLMPVSDAVLLRSKQLPSPMGMYLTAVPNEAKALELQERHGGEVYSYKELAEKIENLPAL